MLNVPLDLQTIYLLAPECLILISAVAIIVVGAFVKRPIGLSVMGLVALVAAVVVLARQDLLLAGQGALGAEIANPATGPLLLDLFGHGLRWLALATGLMFLLISLKPRNRELIGETVGCLMLVFVGLMLVGTASDLVMLFLGLELISIPTYVLLFLGGRGDKTAEATTKYFFLSILSSALLLYGFSFLYGVSSSIELHEIRVHLDNADEGAFPGLMPIALVLIFAGLGFKIAAVPFHFYAPDVYEGTSNINAGLLAVVPKIAGVVALVRILVVAVPTTSSFAWQLAFVMSLLTMTVGNVCALWQHNIRRLMAYSSIAHAGYMLIGFSVALAPSNSMMPSVEALGAILLYLILYVIASVGTFAVLASLSDEHHQVDEVGQLAGLARRHPVLAAAIAVFMFSLSGIPPLAGFWGKLGLFTSALQSGMTGQGPGTFSSPWFVVIAVAGVINAAIAAAYYLRIVATLYFQSEDLAPRFGRGGMGARIASVTCAVSLIVVGLWPANLARLTRSLAISSQASAQPSSSEPLRFDTVRSVQRQEFPIVRAEAGD